MILLLVGTRPEMIKMLPVVSALIARGIKFKLVHSGQHYSQAMAKQIAKDLGLPPATYTLGVGSGSHAQTTAAIMTKFEQVCLEVNPHMIVVQGDTNTALAGALVATKLHIRLAHVEAGLRSFDRQMPEEINRIIVDSIADLLFAPTQLAKANLVKEGISQNKIYVTGNTVVDALKQYVGKGNIVKLLKQHKVATGKFILATLHRQENVDNPNHLKLYLKAIEHTAKKLNIPVILPLHPRTAKMCQQNNVVLSDVIHAINPVGYLDFLALETQCALIMTDSGGIQEEGYVFKKPLLTLRTSTERPETLTANFLVGHDTHKIDRALSRFASGKVVWTNKLGDGHAGVKIVNILAKKL